MPNEKEVKEAAANGGAVCSVTGRPCECLGGGGCRNREPLLDRASEEALRWIRTAHVRLDTVRQALLEADAAGATRRRFPLPEAREWRRRVDNIMRELEEALDG